MIYHLNDNKCMRYSLSIYVYNAIFLDSLILKPFLRPILTLRHTAETVLNFCSSLGL